MRILITGAAGGIGYELGKRLVGRGHTVYFTTHTNRQRKTLEERLKEENVDALCFKMDITTDDIKLVDHIKIDCLVNHAGIGNGGSVLFMDTNVLRQNYEINVFSSFRLLKRVYKNMERDHIKGKIFVTSSLAGYLPIPFLGCYTSSKAAITMLVKTLKEEIKYLKSGISISLIELGAYRTGFNQVMIENKDKFIEENNKIYNHLDSINRIQRNMFCLIEKKNYDPLIKKMIKNIESSHPKFYIREPLLQGVFTKIYLLFH